MTVTYRAGVIGCGRIGSLLDDELFDREVRDESWRARPCTHAGNYVLHPRTELAAGADNVPRRLARYGAKWGVSHLYADYLEMLEKEQLDIVSIATEAPLHHEMTIAAARAGARAVFLEKPIAASLAEADEIIRVCDECGTKLIVNHTYRFHPNLPKAKALIEQGAIGELTTILSSFPRWLLHVGSHQFDLLGYFAGEPDLAFAHLDEDLHIDTQGSGYVHFKSGIRALVDVRPRASFGFLDLMGTTGMIRFVNDINATFELWQAEKRAESPSESQLAQQPFPGVSATEEGRGPARGRFVCTTAIDEIVACLDEQRESLSSGKDARQALEIAMGMYRSHQAGGRAVALPNQERSLYIPEVVPAFVTEARQRF